MIRFYRVEPIPAPRQVRSHKWNPTAGVLRYRAFRDELNLLRCEIPDRVHLVFLLPMPASWSAKRRASMRGMPHQQKPDSENLAKAVLDAVREEDAGVWDERATKFWWDSPGLIVADMGELDGLAVPFDLDALFDRIGRPLVRMRRGA